VAGRRLSASADEDSHRRGVAAARRRGVAAGRLVDGLEAVSRDSFRGL